jgi:hypothetical protein
VTGGLDVSGWRGCCPPFDAERSKSEPSTIVLQGVPCMAGIIQVSTRRKRFGHAIVKLTVTVRIASKPIGAYFHCLTASIADRANASFVDRRMVMSPIVPSA